MRKYTTDNLALCAYLQLKGLKFIESELSIGKHDKPVVLFHFEDKLGLGQDLALEFSHSEIKKYRDIFFFFRGEIENLRRKIDSINSTTKRKERESYFTGEDIKIKEG